MLVNNLDQPRHIAIPVWEIGVMEGDMLRVISTSESGYNVGSLRYAVRAGILEVDIGPVSAEVFCTELL